MAATGTPTPNLGLRIPVGTDPASVDDINYNSNLLDTVLGAVGNTSVKDQLDELSDQIASLVSYQDEGITVGSSQYDGYYYGDKDVSSIANKILAVSVVESPSNTWATATLVNSRTRIRVWTKASSGTVTVRIALKA